jgi:molecular chaperone GrpE
MAKKKDQQVPEENQETEPVVEVLDAEAAEEVTVEVELTLEEQLEACRAEAEENRNQYLRSCADLENFRKRTQREKVDLSRFANEKILREMLPVVDNLGRAIEHADGEVEDTKSLIEGIQLTLDQFAKVLDQFGVKEVEALGKPFNPDFHEAMGQIESAEHPANSVAQVFQKGYLLNDRLLRPALVMIAKGPAEPAAEVEAEKTE